MPFVHRTYKSEKDYQLMRQLLVDNLAINGMPVYLTVGELDWQRLLSLGKGSIRRTELWLDERGRLLGYAWLKGSTLDMLVHPAHHAVEKDMVAWGLEKLHLQQQKEIETHPLTTWCLTRDTARHALFNRLGFRQTKQCCSFFARSLEEPLPEPLLPDGYGIRCLQGQEDLKARLNVQREIPETTAMTLKQYRSLTKFPSYRFDLDLVAVAPGGEFGAFCNVWLDESNHHGALQPLGCSPNHLGKGLESALVVTVLNSLVDHNARTVSVIAGDDNPHVKQLYASLGFRELDHLDAWIKAA